MPSDHRSSWAKGRSFLLLLAFLLCAPFSQALAEKRVALVIGNSDYTRIPALANPARDAELMSETLRGLGFEVIEARDVDRAAMGAAIQEFGRELRGGGEEAVGLFFYAGHGIQARGANYLIPLGARIETEADLEFAAVSAQWVLAQMEFAGNALNIVVLDACRNNPFKSGFRSLGRGLARMDAPRGSLVAYAAAPGQVASDGSGANSPYTAALAKAMREPGLDLEDVFKRVRVAVEDATGGAQTPWEESSLRGDFFFKQAEPEPELQAAAEPAPAPAPSSYDREALFWDSIKDSRHAADFEAYLAQFPEGTFAPLAAARLARLSAAEEPPAPAAEQQVAALPEEAPADPDEIQLQEERALGLTRFQRQEVQRALTALGYDTRGVDGVFGANSRRAIAAYQRDKGEEATGYLTAALQGTLMSDAEEPLARLAEAERRRQEAAQQQRQANEFAGTVAESPTRTAAVTAAPDEGAIAAEIASVEAQIASLQEALEEASGEQRDPAYPHDGNWSGSMTRSGCNVSGYNGGALELQVAKGRVRTLTSPIGRYEGTVEGDELEASGSTRQGREVMLRGDFVGDSFSGRAVIRTWSGLCSFDVALTRRVQERNAPLRTSLRAQIKAMENRLEALRAQ